MLAQLQNYIAIGKDWYNTSQKKIVLASDIKLKNKKLAQELEQECQNQNGKLTYAEYLTISQFGKYGFYTQNTRHGKTDIENRWASALANYCQTKGYNTIVEFGCGAGELGIATVKAYQQKTKKTLSWIGVEIDKNIHEKIKNNFQRHKLEDSLENIVQSLDEIEPRENALILFPYSLDNIPPQLCINTNKNTSYPNALIGIIVQNGKLTESILEPETLQKKGISIKNGIFKQNNLQFDLTSWRLKKGQRAYIPLDSFRQLYNCTKEWKHKANIFIIDEFRDEPWFFSLGTIGTPRSLYEKNLICNDRTRYYQEAGEHNFYYPLYKYTLLKFLHEIGFRSINYEIEQKMAATLQGKPWIPFKKKYSTLAFDATNWTEKENKKLPIILTQKTIM
jgi:hypothetical protein